MSGPNKMSRELFIDTDILIDAARSTQKAISFLENKERRFILMISVITEMELIVGCRNKKELRSLNKFLKRFQIIQIHGKTSELAAQLLEKYRLSHGLLIPDALIAASVISSNAPFATKYKKDFLFIKGLELSVY